MTEPKRRQGHDTETANEPPRSIRVARDDDRLELQTLAVAFYHEDGFTTSQDDLATNLQHLTRSTDAHVAVCELDRHLQAFAITTTSFGLENGRIAELEDLYVTPAYRRRGLAELLINDAAEWARHQGAAHLEVVTAPNGNDISRLNAYYEARGFTYEGRQIRTRQLQPPGASSSRHTGANSG